MTKTNKERVPEYLRSIAPRGATNAQISEATGIMPHQQVFMKTQELKQVGLIQGRRQGRTWTFYSGEAPPEQTKIPERSHPKKPLSNGGELTPREFEALAQRVMSRNFDKQLSPGEVTGVPKRFDFVSADGTIVGDAKYYTLVQGKYLPPAKFSIIAEHVWLLEKIDASRRFLVFGNEINVPRLWLARYGALVPDLIMRINLLILVTLLGKSSVEKADPACIEKMCFQSHAGTAFSNMINCTMLFTV